MPIIYKCGENVAKNCIMCGMNLQTEQGGSAEENMLYFFRFSEKIALQRKFYPREV